MRSKLTKSFPLPLLTLIGMVILAPPCWAQKSSTPFTPVVPKTWDDEVVASLEAPLANPAYSGACHLQPLLPHVRAAGPIMAFDVPRRGRQLRCDSSVPGSEAAMGILPTANARRADSGAVAEARALRRGVIVMAFHERSEIHATAIQEVSR